MELHVDQTWLLRVCFTAIRVGVLFMMTPVFAQLEGLVRIRVLFTLSLSVLLAMSLGGTGGAQPSDLLGLFLGAAGELVSGSVLAFGVFAAFGAFSMAGKILDIQSGFSIGGVYDPVTRSDSPVFGALLNLAGVAMFFALDAHHALLRGVAFSLQQVPPGAGLHAFNPDAVVRQFGIMFSLGVAMAAPVMFCLLLTETGLAILSRSLPQMNVFVVGVPLKILVALAVLSLTAGVLGEPMGQAYASIFTFWEQVLA